MAVPITLFGCALSPPVPSLASADSACAVPSTRRRAVHAEPPRSAASRVLRSGLPARRRGLINSRRVVLVPRRASRTREAATDRAGRRAGGGSRMNKKTKVRWRRPVAENACSDVPPCSVRPEPREAFAVAAGRSRAGPTQEYFVCQCQHCFRA